MLAPVVHLCLSVVLPCPSSAGSGARSEVVSVGNPAEQLLGRWGNRHDRHPYCPGRTARLRAWILLEDGVGFGLEAGRVVRGAQEGF